MYIFHPKHTIPQTSKIIAIINSGLQVLISISNYETLQYSSFSLKESVTYIDLYTYVDVQFVTAIVPYIYIYIYIKEQHQRINTHKTHTEGLTQKITHGWRTKKKVPKAITIT